ncbi:MAG TPA: RNA polymerase sigma factor [Candidatus Cloacimonadota bacterium]|nr:RNA polymerase sigma factor [Candidatus Cloacimonadota bacterium]HOV16374.1 RNA polymerase sigma factor [Candidatus Cloacimonadota bacterium]HQL15303.1 RNA polymerase sigma factor [Candidatus Cloacimonadota bacterium]
MKQDTEPPDIRQYKDIIATITQLTHSKFGFLNISKELCNIVLIKRLKLASENDDKPKRVETIFSEAVEELFSSYYNDVLQYSLSRTQNPELSKDIAQETIFRMLKTSDNISEVSGWIRRVAHNLLCEHYRSKKNEQTLYRSLSCESELQQQLLASHGKMGLADYIHIIPQSVLEGQNYKLFEQMQEYDSIKAFAEAKSISYEAAKSRSRKVLKDLRAEILLSMGWRASPEILNYNQYKAIRSFVQKIKTIGSSTNSRTKLQSMMSLEYVSLLSECTNVVDWGITMVSGGRFRLYLFHLGKDQSPLMVTIYIAVSKNNHVTIESCKANNFAGVHKIPNQIHIPREVGNALWSYDNIISIIKENKS